MTIPSVFFLLADLLMKGAGVVIMAGSVAWLLRSKSAANRNAIWSAAFLVLFLLPATHVISPRWSWLNRQPQHPSMQLQMTPISTIDVQQTSPHSSSKAESIASSIWKSPDLASLLLMTWSAGFLFFLTRRLIGSFQLWNIKQRSISPPSRVLNLARETEEAYRLRRTADVRLSEDRTAPVTWGIFRPVIMLPVEAVEWDDALLKIVLRHEYAHIRRHDSCFRLIAQLACALHWLNPLAWLALRKLRLAQEQAADDLVLRTGVDPIAYADELVACVRGFIQPRIVAKHALAMAQSSTLETRVNAVLDNRQDRRPVDRPLLMSSIAATLLALTGSALAQVSKENVATTPDRQSVSQVSPQSDVEEIPLPVPSDAATSHKTTSAPAPTAEQLSEFSKIPIEINAERTVFLEGIAIAEGKATLNYRDMKFAADSILYSPTTKSVTAKGNVDVTVKNGDRITGANAAVEYNLLTNALKVSGTHRTFIKKKEESK